MKYSIKKYTHISLLLFFFCFMTACSGEDNPVTPEIIPAKSELVFAKAGGTEILSVKSNVALDVKSEDESWCRVAPASSTSAAVYRYTVTVDANPETNDRSTTITVKGATVTQTVNVVQTAADGLIVAPTVFNEVSGEGARIEVKVTTNGTVNVAINDSWMTNVSSRAAMTEQAMAFNVAANYGTPRTGSITFTLGDLTETVTVHQLVANIPDIGMESDAVELAAKMYAGWNIGNTLEAIGGETAWGNPMVTQELLDAVKAGGFNTIRIPCAWNQYLSNESQAKISDAWLKRVKQVVDYC